MNLWNTTAIGVREIAAHKFRSVLSMLGIVLGVSSLIATLALTTGIERGTREFMQQLGGLEFVTVTKKDVSASNSDFASLSPGRTLRDAEALAAAAPLISHISPELSANALATGGGDRSERLPVTGVFPDHFVVTRHDPAVGRWLNASDVETVSRAAVIGASVASTLWPGTPPERLLDRVIMLDNRPFRVVGVLPLYEREEEKRAREKGTQKKYATAQRGRWDPFRRKNQTVLIPLTTMFYDLRAGATPQASLHSAPLDNLTVRVGDIDFFRPALEQIRAVLDSTHRGVDDYDLETREEWFDRMESNIRATRLSGGLIATISLLVGGIGIMNIMLASISERVREIGIRMAVGAKGRDIFLQILVEAVAISLCGALLGVGASFGLVEVLQSLAPNENTPIITARAVLLSIGFALVAGLLSGIYPALRASRLNPISALRYE